MPSWIYILIGHVYLFAIRVLYFHTGQFHKGAARAARAAGFTLTTAFSGRESGAHNAHPQGNRLWIPTYLFHV